MTDALGEMTRWWLTVIGLGLLAAPLAMVVFEPLRDRGWGLTKALALALISWWVFLAGSLNFLPFTRTALLVGIALLFLASLVTGMRRREDLFRFLTRNWRLLVAEELLMGVGFVTWAWIRAHQPDIVGLEKFMDFGFVNAILRTRFFPPPDMWLAGESINYYYFGHLAAAVLIRATGIGSAIGYNLMIATLFSLALAGGFSLGSTLGLRLLAGVAPRRRMVLASLAGGVSALVLVFGGNLHAVVSLLSQGDREYWYPDATRYIPFTIHEFPHYSFVVADLHGHVSNIPYVLATLGMLLSLLLADIRRLQYLPRRLSWVRLGVGGLLLGILYMTNALDAPIYLGVIGVALTSVALAGRFSFHQLRGLGIVLGSLTVIALAASFPFHLSFAPFSAGLALVQTRSSLTQLLVLWGFFLFVGGVFATLALVRDRWSLPKRTSASVAAGFVFLLVGVSFFLVLVPEVVYFKDIYIAEYQRANTMFKLVYQAFLLMSLVTGPVLATLIWSWRVAVARLRLLLLLLLAVFVVGLVSILIYPRFAVASYYDQLRFWRGLDGTAWLARAYPDDAAAIWWLREFVQGSPVIVEAVGESYTDYARVSANTGLPTILGWRVHEWLWRGSFAEPAKRTEEVARLYTTQDPVLACEIIDRYGVEYVFVGALERRAYPDLEEQTLATLGNLVFAQGETRIYRIHSPCGVSAAYPL